MHVAILMSNASIAACLVMGLNHFNAFVCAKGTIIVDDDVFTPKPNNGGQITQETIGKFTDEKVHSWLHIDDEFATNDSCTLKKVAASYFPHILFLASSPSPKGLKLIAEMGKGKQAMLTQQQLQAFMEIWSRWSIEIDKETIAGDGEEDKHMWWDGKPVLGKNENPIEVKITQKVERSYRKILY